MPVPKPYEKTWDRNSILWNNDHFILLSPNCLWVLFTIRQLNNNILISMKTKKSFKLCMCLVYFGIPTTELCPSNTFEKIHLKYPKENQWTLSITGFVLRRKIISLTLNCLKVVSKFLEFFNLLCPLNFLQF